MRRLPLLANRHRSPATNRALGNVLAFNAGAVNSGGFLVLRRYTSHMTGFASQLVDGLVLGLTPLWLGALGAIAAFVAGAAVCALLVNWGRRHRDRLRPGRLRVRGAARRGAARAVAAAAAARPARLKSLLRRAGSAAPRQREG